jgi:hypothetical protein
LAERLALDVSGLRRIARTAEGIRGEARATLLALTDASGLPLTWSHFELLAGVRGTEARMRAARQSLGGHFSVKKLREHLREQEMISRSTRLVPR